MSYICVEGNIGAGKTTFAKRYAELTGRTLILEQFSENPFLASFYKEPKKHAFPLEMSFLAERFQQLNNLFSQPDLFSKGYVADYSFYKTRLFAKINLSEGEFHIFDRLYQVLAKQLPQPDKIIYLQTDIAYIKQNISDRNREIEKDIHEAYLAKVHESYLDLSRSKSNNIVPVAYSTAHWQSMDNLIYTIEKTKLRKFK
jgi:deoxyadenosine/deoxycytidine kinase